MAAVMEDVDVLISVGAHEEAPLMEEVGKWDVYRTPLPTMPFNVTGYPALSLCSGYGRAGLPVSIHLAARPFEEALLLRLGHAYERATEWRDTRPRLARSATV
jgi:aspartyl-tRNA(Asn)/glutamyl-tRNA(Gln) amidotransferase subunit A